MKTQKGIREHDADELRKAKRLEPIRKSGKERHALYSSFDEEDEEEILSSLVREYYGGRTRLPRQILLPCELADQVPLTRMLSEQVGSRVELVYWDPAQDRTLTV